MRSRRVAESVILAVAFACLAGWFGAGPVPSEAQTTPSPIPAPLREILSKLDQGDSAGAEQLLAQNLPRVKGQLEALLGRIDQEFDDLGKYGAVSYKFGPGYQPLTEANRRYQKVFELYRQRARDENLFQRFEARRLRIEGADYTDRGEIACGEKLDWEQAQKFYQTALDRLEASFALAQETKDYRVMASAKNNIGSTLIRLAKPKEALQAYSEGLRYAEQLPGPLYKGLLRLNLGNTYVWVGEPDEALRHLNPALDLFKKMGRGTWIANALMTIGNAYLRQQKYANAWETLQLSLEIARQSKENRVYGRALLNLGMAGMQLQKKEALSLVQKGLEWYETDAGKEVYVPIEREVVRQDGLRLLSQMARQSGNQALAEKYHKEYLGSFGPDPDRYAALRQSPCFEIYQARPTSQYQAAP